MSERVSMNMTKRGYAAQIKSRQEKAHPRESNVPLSVQKPIVECAASRYILSVRLNATPSSSMLQLLFLFLFLVSWITEVAVSSDNDDGKGGNDSICLLAAVFKCCGKPILLCPRLLLILCLIVVT